MKAVLNQRFRGYLPVVMDFETSGVEPTNSAIIQIAAAFPTQTIDRLLSTELVVSWNIKPHPKTKIDQSTYKFHKIDLTDKNRDVVSEEYAFKRLLKVTKHYLKKYSCKRAVVVAHNANFELSFLQAAIERNKIKGNPFHSFTIFDTATLAALAINHTVLAVSCKRAKINFDNDKAHNAVYDTIKTAELFYKIVNEWDIFDHPNFNIL